MPLYPTLRACAQSCILPLCHRRVVLTHSLPWPSTNNRYLVAENKKVPLLCFHLDFNWETFSLCLGMTLVSAVKMFWIFSHIFSSVTYSVGGLGNTCWFRCLCFLLSQHVGVSFSPGPAYLMSTFDLLVWLSVLRHTQSHKQTIRPHTRTHTVMSDTRFYFHTWGRCTKDCKRSWRPWTLILKDVHLIACVSMFVPWVLFCQRAKMASVNDILERDKCDSGSSQTVWPPTPWPRLAPVCQLTFNFIF